MRKVLAAALALNCAAPAAAQTTFDSAQTLTKLDSVVVYDGAKQKPGSAPVFAGTTNPLFRQDLRRPPLMPNLHLDDERMKARDKGVWLGLGAFAAMEAGWSIRYHAKHPWGMGPESPAYMASWAGFILFPLIGEQIGKAIDRRRAKHGAVKEY